MPRSARPTEKLLQVAKGGSSRRRQFSTATRRSLLDVAQEQFTTNGYAGTSLDTIVAGARVTKGALYHHFAGKQALFEAVLTSVETDATQQITAAMRAGADPWERATTGLHAFLDVVRAPAYQRIVIQEGPSVLGHQRLREQEERSTFALVREIVHGVLQDNIDGLDEELLATFARIFFGAMSAAGESVSDADDQEAAVARIETAIGFILAGVRSLGADRGASR